MSKILDALRRHPYLSEDCWFELFGPYLDRLPEFAGEYLDQEVTLGTFYQISHRLVQAMKDGNINGQGNDSSFDGILFYLEMTSKTGVKMVALGTISEAEKLLGGWTNLNGFSEEAAALYMAGGLTHRTLMETDPSAYLPYKATPIEGSQE